MKILLTFVILTLSFNITNAQGNQEPNKLLQTSRLKSLNSHFDLNNQNDNLLENQQKEKNLHSPKSKNWVWDTIYTYDTVGLYQRLTRTFDSQGNVINELTEVWKNNVWINSEIITKTYDINGNILEKLQKEWINNIWKNLWRNAWTYNSNNKVLCVTGEQWINNIWMNFNRYTYTYDSIGNRLTYLYEVWQNNLWENGELNIYTYNSNGKILTSTQQWWQNNTWENVFTFISTYDINGYLNLQITKEWQNNNWENRRRLTYNNDVNGNCLVYLDEVMYSQWTNHEKITATYDANGHTLTSLTENWIDSVWSNYLIYSCAYYSNGNPICEISERWYNNIWMNTEKDTFQYDINHNLLYIINEQMYDTIIGNKIKKYSFSYDANSNSITGKYEKWHNGLWKPEIGLLPIYLSGSHEQDLRFISRYEMNPKSFNIGIKKNRINKNNILVYPNPASNKITIDVSHNAKDGRITISNINGQELIKKQITEDKTQIDISKLANGVYFVKYINDKTLEVKKIIIDR